MHVLMQEELTITIQFPPWVGASLCPPWVGARLSSGGRGRVWCVEGVGACGRDLLGLRDGAAGGGPGVKGFLFAGSDGGGVESKKIANVG